MTSLAPRILIIVRAGRKSIHRSWIWTVHGLADVALSVYDDSDFDGDGARFLHRQPGGKFPGVMAFLEAHPEVIAQYDHFWLFEDDLFLPFESLRKIVALLGRYPFALAAPGLSHDSFFTWALAMANDSFRFRCTDFVEVMAPIMSRDFLRAAMPAFRDNFTAWGHEWLWRKLLQEREEFAAIIDDAPITHTRPFGQGSLLTNRTPGDADPSADLAAFVARYGLDRTTPFRNFFGVTREGPARLVWQDAFVAAAFGGYDRLRQVPGDGFHRCIRTLVADARPVASYETLRRLAGFRMVEDGLLRDAGAAPGAGRSGPPATIEGVVEHADGASVQGWARPVGDTAPPVIRVVQEGRVVALGATSFDRADLGGRFGFRLDVAVPLEAAQLLAGRVIVIAGEGESARALPFLSVARSQTMAAFAVATMQDFTADDIARVQAAIAGLPAQS